MSSVPTSPVLSPSRRVLNQLCWVAVALLGGCLFLAIGYMVPLIGDVIGLAIGVFLAVYLLIWPVDLVERGMIWLLSGGHRSSMASSLDSKTPEQFSRVIRGVAISGVFLVFLTGVTILLTWALPILLKQIQQVVQGLPQYAESVERWILSLLERWGLFGWNPVQLFLLNGAAEDPEHPLFLIQSISDWLGEQGDWLGDTLGNSIKNVYGLVTSTLLRAFYVWLAVPLVFLGLMEGPRTRCVIKSWFSEGSDQQVDVDYLLGEAHQVMMAFLRGQVLLGFITGVFMFFVYQWFGVKFALLLAVIFFVAEILPVIGTWIGIIPGLLVAYLSGGISVAFWVWVCSYSYQTVKDNIVAPKVVGDVMGLHPLVVLVSIVLFTRWFGLVGTLFAIPTTAFIYAAWTYFLQTVRPRWQQPVVVLVDEEGAL